MKTKTFKTVGALHPVLFFVGVYAVALFFSIFICSSLFYSCQSNGIKLAKELGVSAFAQVSSLKDLGVKQCKKN